MLFFLYFYFPSFILRSVLTTTQKNLKNVIREKKKLPEISRLHLILVYLRICGTKRGLLLSALGKITIVFTQAWCVHIKLSSRFFFDALECVSNATHDAASLFKTIGWIWVALFALHELNVLCPALLANELGRTKQNGRRESCAWHVSKINWTAVSGRWNRPITYLKAKTWLCKAGGV